MEDLPPVKGAATIFQKIMYPNKDMLSASIICAGWDPYDGPQIYQLPLGATLIKAKIAMGGKNILPQINRKWLHFHSRIL
jgi:20S proteasome subunit beta 1